MFEFQKSTIMFSNLSCLFILERIVVIVDVFKNCNDYGINIFKISSLSNEPTNRIIYVYNE